MVESGSAGCGPDSGRPDRVGLGCLGLLLPGLEFLQLSKMRAGRRAGGLAAIQRATPKGIGAGFHGDSISLVDVCLLQLLI